jgi:aspartate racemase
MKSVGIIGGLGPETTAEFYLAVTFGCKKINQIKRPLIVISSVPLPFEIENDLIERNFGKERYIPFLRAEAKRLEKSGVDFIVMPCNSLHVFIDEIRAAVKIPVLSIIEETTKYIKANKFQKVGLISTSATVENRVYEDIFGKEKINHIVPSGLQRAQMNRIIQNLVSGIHLDSDRRVIMSVISDLKKQGADAIALACTDLQLLLPDDDEIAVFDTMKILADSIICAIMSAKNTRIPPFLKNPKTTNPHHQKSQNPKSRRLVYMNRLSIAPQVPN